MIGKIEVKCKRKIADYSADHQHPQGSVNDNYSSQQLLNEFENYFKRPVSFLDLGCAGGQLVHDAHVRGWLSVGLEGSDSALEGKGSHNWEVLKDKCLFLTDISEDFTIKQGRKIQKFDVIHSEEVLEHIREDRVDAVLQNVKKHLQPDGIVFLGIAMFPGTDVIDGKLVTYHLCVHDKDWWVSKINNNGFEILEGGQNDDCHAGFIFSTSVRNHQNSLYVCAKHKIA